MNKAVSKIIFSDACHVRKTANRLPDSIRPKGDNLSSGQVWQSCSKKWLLQSKY